MFRLLFIFSLGFLYVLVVSSQVNACISEFDLLLSTYSKVNCIMISFRPYFSIHVYRSFPYNLFSKFDHIDRYKVYANRYRITPFEKALQSYFM